MLPLRFMINLFRGFALRRPLRSAVWAFALACATSAFAQSPGALDTAFNPGAAAVNFSATSVFPGSVDAIAVQGSGTILVGGNFLSANGSPRGYLTRLTSAGALDTTYNTAAGFDDVVRAIALQSNSDAVVGGFFTQYTDTTNDTTPTPHVARLTTAGIDDTGFDVGDGPNSSVRAVAVQSNQDIVIGGFFTTVDGTAANRVARLSTDGTLDASFVSTTGADDSVEAIAVQSNQQIIIGGAFDSYNGTPRSRLARLNTDGSLDTSFTPPFFNGTVRGVAVQSADQKIVVVGDFQIVANGVTTRGIVRLNTNGSIDPAFLPGSGADNSVEAVVLSGTNILIGGDFASINGTAEVRVARLTSTGAVDPTFSAGSGANAIVRAIAVDASNNVLIGGDFSSVNGTTEIALARLTTTGTVDMTFNSGGQGFGFTATEVDALSYLNNKIYVGGNFQSIDGLPRNDIDRLNSDGSADSTFNPGTGADGTVRAVAPDIAAEPNEDGTTGVFIGGDFQNFDENASPGVARLNPDGSFDTDFDVANGVDGTVRSLAVDADDGDNGLLYIGGDFTRYNGVTVGGIVRVDASTGARDTSFSKAGTDNSVRAIVVDSNDQVLIGGDFVSVNGVTRNHFARLNEEDGSPDPTFNAGTGANDSVYTIAVQPDGRIVIGGSFSMVDGTAHQAIARLNSDGTLDTGFNAALSSTATVDSISIQADGKIVIGGDFTSVSGFGRADIARLNTDGSIDSAFNPGAGANGTVRAVVSKPNGKTVIGGIFSTVNNTPRARLAQLQGDTSPGTVQFSAATFTGSEASGKAVLTVTRTGGTAGTVMVSYSTADGSAMADPDDPEDFGDYVPDSGVLTFGPGVTSKTITITVNQDAVVEGTEYFYVNLSAPDDDVNLGTPSRATVNITDNPPASLQFTASTYTGAEAAPSGLITVAVSRTLNSVGAVQVTYTLMDGTAVAGVDYVNPGPQILTWADGDTTTKTFTVQIINDNIPKAPRSFTAVLSDPGSEDGFTVADGAAEQGTAVLGTPFQATLTITDDDVAPSVQFSAATYTVNEGAGNAVLTVTRSGSSVGTVTVDYVSTSSGTAVAGTDYTPVVGTLTFPAGDLASRSFVVPILDNGQAGGPKTIGFSLSNPTNSNGGVATIGTPATATLTIINDNMPSTVQFTMAGYNVSAGTTSAVIMVSRAGVSTAAITVDFATADGTAKAGTDYTATKGTLSFAAGDSTAKLFLVPIAGSTANEPEKTLTVMLANPTGGATLGPTSQATVTILGTSSSTVTVVAKHSQIAQDGGVGKFIFTRSGDTSGALTVNYRFKGSAVQGVAFTGGGSSVVIPAGQTTAKIKIHPVADSNTGTPENVKLLLLSGNGYTLGQPAVARLTIED